MKHVDDASAASAKSPRLLPVHRDIDQRGRPWRQPWQIPRRLRRELALVRLAAP